MRIFLFLFAISRSFIAFNCAFLFPTEKVFFDFGAFNRRQSETLDTKYGKIVFRVCGRVAPPRECVNAPPSAGGYLINAKKQCLPILAQNALFDDVWFSGDGEETRLSRKSLGSKFEFAFFCRANRAEPLYSVYDNKVIVETRSACKLPPFRSAALRVASISALSALMAIGLFLAFFGGVQWRRILLFGGFAFGAFGAAAAIAALVISEQSAIPFYAFPLFALLAALCGIAGAHLFVVNAVAAALLVGFATGFALSVGAAALIGASQNWISICFHLTFALIGALLSFRFIDAVIAVATSVGGAFAFAFGLYWLLNGALSLPNALRFLKSGERSAQIAYIAIFAAVSLFGSAFQFWAICRRKAKSDRTQRIDIINN